MLLSLSFDRAAEEFDAIRIPQWFLRANYTIPNTTIPDLTAEFLLNPGAVVPTILPAQGSPYNVVPSVAKLTDQVRQGEPTIGGRLTGTAADVQFSLNFITKPNECLAETRKRRRCRLRLGTLMLRAFEKVAVGERARIDARLGLFLRRWL